MAPIARKVLMGLAWLYVLGVVIQFFLAGLGAISLRSFDTHEAVGYSALHLTPILFIIAAAVGRVGRNLLILIIVFAVVAFVQPIWASEFRGEILGAFHVLGALVIFVLAHAIAQRATALVRADRTA